MSEMQRFKGTLVPVEGLSGYVNRYRALMALAKLKGLVVGDYYVHDEVNDVELFPESGYILIGTRPYRIESKDVTDIGNEFCSLICNEETGAVKFDTQFYNGCTSLECELEEAMEKELYND